MPLGTNDLEITFLIKNNIPTLSAVPIVEDTSKTRLPTDMLKRLITRIVEKGFFLTRLFLLLQIHFGYTEVYLARV
jgi:hypothetical protein